MRVEATTCAALFSAANFDDLVAEYALEGKIDGLPDPSVKLATYEVLECAGLIHPFGAWDGDRLIGFIAVLASTVPHYVAVRLCCTESFFVAKADRGGGAGLALLKAAEGKARELGATGLLISAPAGGSLAKVLPRLGYHDASRVFFKRFQDA